jgi:hypothetical protein
MKITFPNYFKGVTIFALFFVISTSNNAKISKSGVRILFTLYLNSIFHLIGQSILVEEK